MPSRAVATVYRSLFRRLLRRTDPPRRRARALLSGDAENPGGLLSRRMCQALSFSDPAGRRPEAVSKAFIVGLRVQLEASHDVRSNRERGLGARRRDGATARADG